jgi:hypothetical protein
VLQLLRPLASFSEGTVLFAFEKGRRRTSHFICILNFIVDWLEFYIGTLQIQTHYSTSI